MDLQLPDRYQLDEGLLVREGSVLGARDGSTGDPVTIRVLGAGDGLSGLRAAARFDHPHLAPVLEIGTLAGGVPYLARPRAQGSFEDLVREPLPWADLLRLVGELSSVVSWLHARGVAHGGVGPRSVLLREVDGVASVWLADLGVDRSAREARQTGDVRAVAALLWSVLTGGVDASFPARVAVPDHVEATLRAGIDGEFAAVLDLQRALEGAAELAPPGALPWRRPAPPPFALPEESGASVGAALRGGVAREARIVGHDVARKALTDELVAAADRARVVVLVGDAGSGKTLLARRLLETVRQAGLGGGALLRYVAEPGVEDGYPAFVRHHLREAPQDPADRIAWISASLQRERGQAPDVADAEARAIAAWLAPDASVPVARGLPVLFQAIDAQAWRGRGVLVLDEPSVCRLDGDGLGLAAALQGSARPWLIVVTLRRDALVDRGVARQVDGLLEAGARRVDVGALSDAAVAELVRSVIPASDRLVAEITAKVGGNPAFARQLVLQGLARGVWIDGTGGVDVDEASRGALPDDPDHVARLLLAAVAQASGGPRRLLDGLHLIALAGGSVPLPVAVTFLGPDLLLEAQSWGLLVRGDGGVGFGSRRVLHAAREAAQARPDVRYLHHRLAQATLRHGQEVGAVAALATGRHALLEGDRELGLPALDRAARFAWRTGRVRWLHEASAQAVADDQAPASAWLWRGRALEARGDHRSAVDPFTQAREGFLALGQEGGRVEATLGLSWCHRQNGEIDDALRLADEAIEDARGSGVAALEAAGLCARGWAEVQRRRFDAAGVSFEQAVHRVASSDQPGAVGDALLGQAFVARWTGRFEESAELYDEAADAFREAFDEAAALEARLGMASALVQGQRFDDAEGVIDAVTARADEVGNHALMMEVTLARASLVRLRGAGDGATELYERYLTWAGRHRVEGAVNARLGLAQLALAGGREADAYEQTNAAAALLDALPGHHLWARYRLAVSALLAMRGDHMQTWQWLWSANELGIGDTVDRDTADLVSQICNVGKLEGWGNVIRVAGQLAVQQLEKLGEGQRAKAIQQEITGMIRK